MDSTQRSEFKAHLGALFGAWGRTVWEASEEGYWKGLSRMSLADFARCVDRAAEQFAEEPDMKLPTVGALWSIKRGLRAQVPRSAVESRSEPQADNWELAANQHLLAYIRQNAKRYHPDAGMQRGSTLAIVGPLGTAIAGHLVRAKKAWAQCMREEAINTETGELGGVEVETQQAMWKTFMAQAEEQIDELLKSKAA